MQVRRASLNVREVARHSSFLEEGVASETTGTRSMIQHNQEIAQLLPDPLDQVEYTAGTADELRACAN